MKKRLISTLLCATMVAGCLTGCGTKSNGSGSDASDSGEASEEEPVVSTYGDKSGTHLDLWTFVDAHAAFYGNMVEKWNEENPDKKLEMTATTYPYGDMHNKLIMSLQSGTGAPDIVDVEVSQFPNVVAGEEEWLYALDDAAAPYLDDMVTARMDTYKGGDGHYYGAPFHVGAMVMYYNLGVLEEAGITKEDVDAVVTWDDYQALGEKYMAAQKEEGKYFTSVDTAGGDWLWLSMAEYGDDWTGGFEGKPNVQLESVEKMLTMQQNWMNDGLAKVTPDGQIDTEAGKQSLLAHEIVSFPKALWFMSRFLNEIPEEKGNWYLAKCPVWKEGQKASVGVGGTGTVVTAMSKNKELAAEWLCWAKMSETGETSIWEELGFDVCNTSLWADDEFAHNKENKYNTFFRNYPYDVLNSIKDDIGKVSVVKNSLAINEQINTNTLNEIFEDGMDVKDALQEAQDAIELEAE